MKKLIVSISVLLIISVMFGWFGLDRQSVRIDSNHELKVEGEANFDIITSDTLEVGDKIIEFATEKIIMGTNTSALARYAHYNSSFETTSYVFTQWEAITADKAVKTTLKNDSLIFEPGAEVDISGKSVNILIINK